MGIHLLMFCWLPTIKCGYNLGWTEIGERVSDPMMENSPNLCRVEGGFAMWMALVGASRVDVGLGVVL